MFSENRVCLGRRRTSARVGFAALVCLATAAFAWGQEERGLGLILVSTEAEASELRRRLEAGESFDTLAREHSLDPSSSVGGYLGAVRIGDLRPEFRSALEGLNAGEVSRTTPVDDRYALLRFITAEEQDWVRTRDTGLGEVRDERYDEAAQSFNAAIQVARGLVPEDSRLGTSLNDLAELRRLQGDLPDAARIYRQALDAWDSALGPGHRDTAPSLNRLAEIHLTLGDYTEAAAAFGRSLAIWERLLGPDHANVAANLNSLGLIRHFQEDYAEARLLFQRALGIWESALGPDHPNVASALGNLAAVEMLESRHAEAEILIRRSLAIVERTLGPDHPEVARNLDGLAELRGLQGDWQGAAGLYAQSLGVIWGSTPRSQSEVIEVLERFVDVLTLPFVGEYQHDDTVNRFEQTAAQAPIRESLYLAMSGVLDSEGHSVESESILVQAAGRFPDSRLVRYRLADLAASNGRILEALEGLDLARNLAGSEPGIGTILTRQGDLLVEIARPDDARSAYLEALDIAPAYSDAWLGLGILDVRSGVLEDALSEFSNAALLNPDHPLAHYRMSETNLRLGRLSEAAAAAARVLELDPNDRRARYIRGRALAQMGRDEEGLQALAEYTRLEERARSENQQLLAVSRIERDVRTALAEGHTEQAIRLLEAGTEDHPNAYRLVLAMGLTESRSGLHQSAVQTLESMIERGIGDDSVIRKALAGAYVSLDESAASERNGALYLERLGSELEAGLPQ